MSTKTRAVQVAGPGEKLELVERDLREPGRGEVRVRVEACGVCHSDAITVEGWMPVEYPRVPGHEIAGVIEAVGEDVTPWEVGQRVGVGWFGGNCGYCDPCRRGDMISCENGQVPGIAYDGGYADHVIVPKSALASIPDDLSSEDAGAAAVRRHHDVQLAARERRPPRRPGGDPRHRRPRAPRRAVRPPDGLRDRRDRPRHRQARAGAASSAPTTTSTRPRRTSRTS